MYAHEPCTGGFVNRASKGKTVEEDHPTAIPLSRRDHASNRKTRLLAYGIHPTLPPSCRVGPHSGTRQRCGTGIS